MGFGGGSMPAPAVTAAQVAQAAPQAPMSLASTAVKGSAANAQDAAARAAGIGLSNTILTGPGGLNSTGSTAGAKLLGQ